MQPRTDSQMQVIWEIVPFTRGRVLSLGAGEKLFKHFTDLSDVHNCGDVASDLDLDTWAALGADLDGAEAESFDAVFCDKMLQPTGTAALAEWWRVLKVGGYFVLHIEEHPAFGATAAVGMLRDVGGWDLQERTQFLAGDTRASLLVFQKMAGPAQKNSYMTRATQKKPTACVVRYGGFGDMLQAANVFPALQDAGYHVTVMTTPKGQDVVKSDPHVDAWFIQDDNQVPNHRLPEFWAYQARKFDKFVQLSESVEGTLIAMPGRANHAWPHAVRDKHLNQNYLEFTSELAGVPYESRARFYPTDEEQDAATYRLPDGMVVGEPRPLSVVFALAGSSVHKFYPGQDIVIARILLEFPDCRIFLVGDPACKMLELGWENEPRVVCLSGEIGIRDTLALAQVADVVIGPETGVLNAVAFEPNRKVVLLSHSSVENLTKHWENTVSVKPVDVACYPCHQLHYNRDHCPQDEETGASVCQRSIHPGIVFEAIVA